MGKPKKTTPAPVITGKRETGIVRWFNVDKGYGFIIPDADGADVFVHMYHVTRSGLGELRDNDTVSYVLAEDLKNSKRVLATQIVVIESKTKKAEKKRAASSEGVVKWFDPKKGFGFITPDAGGKDVFVHISAVKTLGLDVLEGNQRIAFTVQPGRDGRTQAVALRLL